MNRVTIRILLILLMLLVVSGLVLHRLAMPGALFLTRFVEDQSDEAAITVRDQEIPWGEGPLPARIYLPEAGYERVVLLIHGVHYKGMEEPRLVRFARLLAGIGHAVVTPELAGLMDYEIEPRSVDAIERSALWLLDESGLVTAEGDGKAGLMGISFSGGLCLSAAQRPGLENRAAYVFSFGGHGDLDRTLRYLATGGHPEGGELPPHIYGQAVLLRMFAHQLVAGREQEPLRQALYLYLCEEFEAARETLPSLAPPSRKLVQLCLDRDTATAGKILLPLVDQCVSPTCLSPNLDSPPSFPVFLLHGAGDNVIPAAETAALTEWASGGPDSMILISKLIQHVELGDDEESPSRWEAWKIIRFWTELLRR